MERCRCQNEEFLALFERSGWFMFANGYIRERDAGVAPSPDTLSYHEKVAVTTLHHLIEEARADYMESKRTKEGDVE